MNHTRIVLVISAAAALFAGCSDDNKPKTDDAFKAEVVTGMHTRIGDELAALIVAAQDLQAAAPDHAWNATTDATAIANMKAAWKRTRVAYEHVEGATAPIFGDLDESMDFRYDDFLDKFRPDTDDNLFDDQRVTGMHAIERILFSREIRKEVLDHEEPLDGYRPAAFPANSDEALAFKNLLVQRLIDDARMLHDSWQPSMIDLGSAFQGLVGLMNEQGEKVDLAATGEEESRYANITLFDLRNNLAGTKLIYDVFREWVKSKPEGVDPDAKVVAKLAALDMLYSTTTSESLPPVPETWSSDSPTEADLATPFGMLWKTVRSNVDKNADGSVVFEMHQIAEMLQFQELPE
jgi:iron uptake system component EfeO